MNAFVGDFNGATLTVVDDETGLIKSNHGVDSEVKDVRRDVTGRYLVGVGSGYSPIPVFTIAKKLEVLNRLSEVWPNVSLACRLSGVSRQTFSNHMAIDKVLRECVEEFENRFVDDTEGVRFRLAQTTAGALDRMAVLNAYRRERYNPKTEIEIKHSMTPSEARESFRRMESAVDAEVVETVRRLKSKAQGALAPKTKSHE